MAANSDKMWEGAGQKHIAALKDMFASPHISSAVRESLSSSLRQLLGDLPSAGGGALALMSPPPTHVAPVFPAAAVPASAAAAAPPSAIAVAKSMGAAGTGSSPVAPSLSEVAPDALHAVAIGRLAAAVHDEGHSAAVAGALRRANGGGSAINDDKRGADSDEVIILSSDSDGAPAAARAASRPRGRGAARARRAVPPRASKRLAAERLGGRAAGSHDAEVALDDELADVPALAWRASTRPPAAKRERPAPASAAGAASPLSMAAPFARNDVGAAPEGAAAAAAAAVDPAATAGALVSAADRRGAAAAAAAAFPADPDDDGPDDGLHLSGSAGAGARLAESAAAPAAAAPATAASSSVVSAHVAAAFATALPAAASAAATVAMPALTATALAPCPSPLSSSAAPDAAAGAAPPASCGACSAAVPATALRPGGTAVRLSRCGCVFCLPCFRKAVQRLVTLRRVLPADRVCPGRIADGGAAAAGAGGGAAADIVVVAAGAAGGGSPRKAAARPLRVPLPPPPPPGRVCGAEISEEDITAHCDAYWLGRYNDVAMEAMLSSMQGMHRCPDCRGWVEMAEAPPGASVGPQRGDTGAIMSAAAVAHRDAHRMRCPVLECGTNWCTACEQAPYHLGRTCEDVAAHAAAAKCRFCDTEIAAPAAAAAAAGGGGSGSRDVCDAADCAARAAIACPRTLPCGHACGGVRGEAERTAADGGGCPPCLDGNCVAIATVAAEGGGGGGGGGAGGVSRPTRDDYCAICYTEGLGAAPSIRLGCGHALHLHCVKGRLAARWPGARITFAFMACPLCSTPIAPHWALAELQAPLLQLKAAVEGMAQQRLKHEALDKDPLIAARYGGSQLAYAMDRFAYYPCFKCKRPYFGGARQCGVAGGVGPAAAAAAGGGGGDGGGGADAGGGADGAAIGGEEQHLVCPACTPVPAGAQVCPKHGKEWLERKCRYCCSPAIWHCWGTHSFCDPCHVLHMKGRGGWWQGKKSGAGAAAAPVCGGKASCPLRCSHPPHGEEFSLGCGECRIEGSAASAF